MDYEPFHCNAINLFVTSRVKHTPYKTFLAVYFLLLQLRHAIVLSFFKFWSHPPFGLVCRLYFVISISTGYGVFFIDLQDMYQIKEIEPFQHYRLFCGIWQRKTISCCLIYIAIASRNQSFRGFLVTKSRRETKENRFVLRSRHAVSPFETSSIISIS